MSTATPKFLTENIARQAVETALVATRHGALLQQLKRQAFHVVILVPSGRENPLAPRTLYEHSLNGPAWTADYQNIARSKADQLWFGRQDGGTDMLPHLLFDGDCVYSGGVKREGIVVACSGVQPYFDRLIAGMVADTCIALAYCEWEKHRNGKGGDKDFLD